MVNFEFSVGPECVANCSDNVMFMICGPVFCRKNVIRYSVVCLPMRVYELFVVLEALMFGVGYGGEAGGGRVFSFGYVFAEVHDRRISQVHTDD